MGKHIAVKSGEKCLHLWMIQAIKSRRSGDGSYRRQGSKVCGEGDSHIQQNDLRLENTYTSR